MEAMQPRINGRALQVVAAFVALVIAALIGTPSAYADTGEVFSASGGFVAGAPASIGTALDFKVLSEPSGDEPGTVQVGNGSATAIDAAYAGHVTIPEVVEHDARSYRVVSFAANSFRFSNLSAITVPSTLRRICSYSFYCCSQLARFEYQGKPTLEYIEGHAFEIPNATGALVSMRFPASLRSIGVYSFAGQSTLKTVSFEGESLDHIGQYAFMSCTGLKEVHVPELTAEASSLGGYCFTNCTNLELVVFEGNVASFPDELIGTRYFDNCENLKTVVYRGKKVVPSWKRYGSSTDLFYEFTASNPTLYYTISYYGSLEDAQAGSGALGSVCVRSDTPLAGIAPGMKTADEAGAIVWDGAPLALPAGADAWCYEGNPLVIDAPDDSLFAYPVNSHDLESANVSLAESALVYTGKPLSPKPTVITALGKPLREGIDYELVYEREDDEGTWSPDHKRIDVGSLRVKVVGIGDYTGERVVPFSIAYAQEGDVFTSKGVTYLVTKATDGSFEGEASVGDGSACCVPTDTEGTVKIPATVRPDGSTVTYRVTALSSYAFGSTDAGSSCAKLERVVLPDGIETIGTCAFSYCSKLESMTIPSSVSSIGARAFQNCIKLGELTFEGDHVEQFSTYCFAFCTSLTHVELPAANVFRDHVFANCTRLSRVDFLGDVAEGDATQFAGCMRLMRVVYHTPNVWGGSFSTSPTIYGEARFVNAARKELGSAVLKVGTPLANVVPAIESSYLLEGAVPAVPKGFGYWKSASYKGSFFTGACTMVPAGKPGEAPGIAVGKKAVGGSGAAKATYRVTSSDEFTVAYVAPKSKNAKAATVPATVQLEGDTYTVTAVSAHAFKGTRVAQVTVKSKSIGSFKNAFASSKVKTVVAPKAKKADYGKLLSKQACGKAVEVVWK